MTRARRTRPALAPALCLALSAGAVAAEPPARSIAPQPRSEAVRIVHAAHSDDHPWYDASDLAVPRSVRPEGRGRGLMARVRGARDAREHGAVCGDAALRGERIGDVPGPGSCGVEDAVRLRWVAGVALSQPATVDCGTARALGTWVERGVLPAVGDTGGGVARLRVAAHYVCRTRNHRPGARLSQHSHGRAIDISAIELRNGRAVSVLKGWGAGNDGAMLRRMHRAACGPFGTVLGPESDRFHRDHFHFDTARYRAGAYCR